MGDITIGMYAVRSLVREWNIEGPHRNTGFNGGYPVLKSLHDHFIFQS